ncbi:beta-ketoacyl-ACP synthase II [Streptomyces sp. NRRL F-5126]|uniref:beta-ketoacyl-ACP synthase II n=1 Tax=Streptomyces sp. NRRL F-5126 TaxID=1463857 RepID=UPI000A671116|nr:beta-ketoacyl-ACP synthase II [Streptomyces sp. NRRL F-5126]
MQSNQQVVVTGFGALTPVGNDRESTWQALLAGKSGVAPITRFNASGMPTSIAGEVTGFDPADLLDRKRQRRSARFSQLAIAAAREAVADAGLTIGEEDGGAPAGRVGVVVNNAVAGMDGVENAVDTMHMDPRKVNPYFVSSVIPNMPACEVAIDLGVRGPVTASALACASGIYALLEARRLILSGEADVVIAGGTDSAITPVMFSGLSNMGALSRRNDDPAHASRPFDADRDGFVFGEGAVVCVLESAEHAQARGARPYAEVAGGALTSDAFHVSAPDPSGEGAMEAMRLALRASDTDAGDIDYICAHGTSTRINDLTETRAIRGVYGSHAYDLTVSSPKSMVGHLIGAAGSLSAMVCALAIRDGVVPPTINLDTPGEECDLDYVPHTARQSEVRAAAVNAFGFGGQNCVAVLRAV